MNEQVLYNFAYTICKVIDEKNDLKRENEHLKKELKTYNDYLNASVQNDNQFIGELFSTLLSNASK